MALTKISNNSLSAISSLPASIPTGALTLLSTQTASSSASIEFTSGIDSTYDSYVFKFIDIHPASSSDFQFQTSTDGGSTYGVTLTSTYFYAYHAEDGTASGFTYFAGGDQAQGTSFQRLTKTNNNNDSSNSGSLILFNPSSTTYVKHYMSVLNTENSDFQQNPYTAGYFNTTTAINAVKFQMSSGNIDDGIIKMYGVS